MGNYSIKDLEYLSGIKAHTLRIWEQRYGIIIPKRTATKIRYYDDSDVRQLLNVAFLNHNGYKISKIAKLSTKEINALVEDIAVSSADYNTQIATLILAMVNLDEQRFNQVIKLQSEIEGFEQTALQIIFPFLTRVGILWQTGDVNPAQEHFISGLIRQKLLAAIDNSTVEYNENTKKFLLFLPEGEWHEIGLLFAYYLIKKRHHKVIYLGQSMPFDDLASTVQVYEPQLLVTSITSYPVGNKVVNYAEQLLTAFPNQTIVLSGSQVIKEKDNMPKGLFIMETIHLFVEYLEGRNKSFEGGNE